MSVIADTTSQTITGKNGTADFTMGITTSGSNVQSFKCILDSFRFREVIEMTNADTFCIEGVADQEPGRSQLVFEITGLGKQYGPASGPLILAKQNVPIVATFAASNTLSLSANLTEATADRMVNQNMRIGARGLSKGVYAMSWLIAPV